MSRFASTHGVGTHSAKFGERELGSSVPVMLRAYGQPDTFQGTVSLTSVAGELFADGGVAHGIAVVIDAPYRRVFVDGEFIIGLTVPPADDTVQVTLDAQVHLVVGSMTDGGEFARSAPTYRVGVPYNHQAVWRGSNTGGWIPEVSKKMGRVVSAVIDLPQGTHVFAFRGTTRIIGPDAGPRLGIVTLNALLGQVVRIPTKLSGPQVVTP